MNVKSNKQREKKTKGLGTSEVGTSRANKRICIKLSKRGKVWQTHNKSKHFIFQQTHALESLGVQSGKAEQLIKSLRKHTLEIQQYSLVLSIPNYSLENISFQ